MVSEIDFNQSLYNLIYFFMGKIFYNLPVLVISRTFLHEKLEYVR